MKRIIPFLLLAALGVAGCLPLHQQQRPPQVELQPPPEPNAVLAEEVNEQNAAEKARALAEEIRRDSRRRTGPEAAGEEK